MVTIGHHGDFGPKFEGVYGGMTVGDMVGGGGIDGRKCFNRVFVGVLEGIQKRVQEKCVSRVCVA